MKLSQTETLIAPDKLRDYLLSPSHPEGRTKAAYLARLGYSQENWARLEEDLRQQHLSHEAIPSRLSAYGRKYEILAPVTGPSGLTAWIRSIWIVRTQEDRARLVTLVPEDRP